MLLLILRFFFQAEDGIRDLVRSRGLGDVYKRQVYELIGGYNVNFIITIFLIAALSIIIAKILGLNPVSYTHLTLPTIYSV